MVSIAPAERHYRIDYLRGAGKTSWAVWLITVGLTANGEKWIGNFATREDAMAWINSRKGDLI